MTANEFRLKLFGMVLAIAGFQVLGIVLVLSLILQLSSDELIAVLVSPYFGPPVVLGIVIFMLVALLYSRSLTRLLSGLERGELIPGEEIVAVQDRALQLPPMMGGVAACFFTVGTAALVIILSRVQHWEKAADMFGLFVGLLSGILAFPMFLYFGNGLIFRVIKITTSLPACPAPARVAGLRVSVPMKIVMPVVTMVAASSGLMALVAYSRTQQNFEWIYFLAIWVACILVSVPLALVAGAEFARPIRQLRRGADRVMKGQYQQPVKLVINDDLAELGEAFNRMMATINQQFRSREEVVSRLRSGIMKLDETADALVSIASEQSVGASEQASAVAQTSSISQEILAAARQISERAGAVEQVAGSALAAGKDGEKKLAEARSGFMEIAAYVDQFAHEMEELEGRFKEIYKFVEWMQEIADQTELLALNAALEAAGAGAAGLRFNVVAEATRKLAIRAGSAADEIRLLVEAVQEITVGSTHMALAGRPKVEIVGKDIAATTKILKQISDFANSTLASIREIGISTRQQTTATEQLAGSVSEVAGVARQVEDGAKQIESAIASLRAFSESLSEMGKTEGESRETIDGNPGGRRDHA